VHGGSDAGASALDPNGLGATMAQTDFGGQNGQARLCAADQKRTSARLATLSIDPKLVRPRPGTSEGGPTAKPSARSAQGEEAMVTARPKKKGGERGNKSPKAKKVSHARKVRPDYSADGSGIQADSSQLNADHIPRPRNAFILFRKHVVDAKLIPPSVEIRHQNVSVIVAKMWADAPLEEKARFSELARIEKEDHLKK
jgi:HMG box factor